MSSHLSHLQFHEFQACVLCCDLQQRPNKEQQTDKIKLPFSQIAVCITSPLYSSTAMPFLPPYPPVFTQATTVQFITGSNLSKITFTPRRSLRPCKLTEARDAVIILMNMVVMISPASIQKTPNTLPRIVLGALSPYL